MSQTTFPVCRFEQNGFDIILHLAGDWIARETGLGDTAALKARLDAPGTISCLRIDTAELGRWDSALIVFLQDVRRIGADRHLKIDETALPDSASRILALAAESTAAQPVAPPEESLLEQTGLSVISEGAAIAALNRLIGETVLRSLAAFGGKVRTRAVDVLNLMQDSGPGALLIVTIVNGLVGAILAFVGAVQLRRFGAEIFVADLVGIALVREMAAVMTGIVMAGRTGGAFAAHIATMQGNEEIDALEVFGIPTVDYLVMPRIAALVAMMPLLYFYACAVGLLGGLLVSMSVLDLTVTAYVEETRNAIEARHFVIGFIKSISFGALVAIVGCHIGLRAGRSAADVGRAATGAVVAGIIGIIALDAIYAVCTNALGV